MKISRPHSCNVVQVGADVRQLWQFATGNGDVSLNAEQRLAAANPLPPRLVAKSWRTLWQKKLNIAWLPADQVFLRVVHLPAAEPSEVLAMVELQLEKLSPLPVNQIVWSAEILPGAADGLQTVVVVIAKRNLVEEFLGQLETGGYLTDRLELPFLHELLTTQIDEDGVWTYLQAADTRTLCLVAWWFGGVLRQLNLLHLAHGPAGAAQLSAQLANIAWAGELEGWLAGRPRWHLVAAPETAAVWEPELRRWTGDRVETSPPLPVPQLAALSAQRIARAESKSNLLPVEFAARYRQQFIDRLWMRGLGGLLMAYLAGVLVYFSALQVLKYQTGKVQDQVAALSGTYGNALQLKERLRVLQEQVNLKYAALDCWKLSAELLPAELTLNHFSFSKSSGKVSVRGSARLDDQAQVAKYNDDMRSAILNGKPAFDRVGTYIYTVRGDLIDWSFECDLPKTEIQ